MSKTIVNIFTNVVDWVGILVAYIIARAMAIVESLVLSRLHIAKWSRIKYKVLTGLGLTDILWNMLLLGVLIAYTLSSVTRPNFLSATGLATYLAFFVSANVMLSVPLLALRKLASRWEVNHWVFHMANDILTVGKRTSVGLSEHPSQEPKYIQLFRRTTSVLIAELT